MNTVHHHPGRTPAERRAILAHEDRMVKAPAAAHITAGFPMALRVKLRHQALVAVARNHPGEYLEALAQLTGEIRSRWPE